MHVAVMGKRPYMQIVGVVDVFADLEHQRQRVIRPQIGGNHLGDIADRPGKTRRASSIHRFRLAKGDGRTRA